MSLTSRAVVVEFLCNGRQVSVDVLWHFWPRDDGQKPRELPPALVSLRQVHWPHENETDGVGREAVWRHPVNPQFIGPAGGCKELAASLMSYALCLLAPLEA